MDRHARIWFLGCVACMLVPTGVLALDLRFDVASTLGSLLGGLLLGGWTLVAIHLPRHSGRARRFFTGHG